MQTTEKILSCDWGTSSFRLKLVRTSDFSTEGEERSQQGIASTYAAWKERHEPEENRALFYLTIITEHIKKLEQKSGTSLVNTPIVISGMASSTIGMIDIPYKDLPFSMDGSDLEVKTIAATENFWHPILLISGARTANDVMRGEETQLVGSVAAKVPDKGKQLFILPGTHSKHVVVKESRAITFHTYMTGEFFNLLSTKSILAASVEEGETLETPPNKKAFEKGVGDSRVLNLLHSSFLVRTNQLFHTFTKKENYYYLSGLLIGTELRELLTKRFTTITVIGNPTLIASYATAFTALGLSGNRSEIKLQPADEVTIKGQYKIFMQRNHTIPVK